MNAPRFYCPLALAEGLGLDLPENAARHAAKALRLGVGDDVVLFNGEGGEYPARIVAVGRHAVSVEVGARRDVECESKLRITLVQALQTGDKMDLTIQKAVELGVARVVPALSQRSVLRLQGERAERRVAHWRGVAESACEQCGRNRVPEVTDLVGVNAWLARTTPGAAMRLMLAPGGSRTLTQLAPPPDGRIELLVGAEGGLAPEEIEAAAAAGFMPIRLGPRVLRTETAGMAALAALQCLWGDFGEGADHV